jgi:hypothetical protein
LCNSSFFAWKREKNRPLTSIITERAKMGKLKLSIAFLLIAFMTNGVSAITSYNWNADVQGYWGDSNGTNWKDELGNTVTTPDGLYEVKIKHPGSVVTLNTIAGGWNYTGNGTRLRVYQGATLNIVDGGELSGFGWIRIGEQTGTPEQVGYLNQTGGLVFLRKLKETGKLAIGDGYGINPGSTYTMSGGTLTYDRIDPGCAGQLIIGSRDGEGTFVVVGNAPVIHMRNLYIAGDSVANGGGPYNNGVGTLKFMVGENGVSPIILDSTAYIDQGSDTIANLVVSLTSAPPIGQDIPLVDATTTIHGFFDSLNGGSAAEGASVSLNFNSFNYNYTLTYAGGSDSRDIVLLYVPEPATIVLLGLGLLLSAVKKH